MPTWLIYLFALAVILLLSRIMDQLGNIIALLRLREPPK